jgi:hypothetical protein
MMGGISDPNDDDDFDLSGLACPKCGCPDVEVVKWPRGNPPRLVDRQWEGSWSGSTGRAVCRHCRIKFSIKIVPEEEQE